MRDKKVLLSQDVDKDIELHLKKQSHIDRATLAKHYPDKKDRAIQKTRDRDQTVQIRISQKWYQKIKELKIELQTPLSKILSMICREYFRIVENLVEKENNNPNS